MSIRGVKLGFQMRTERQVRKEQLQFLKLQKALVAQDLMAVEKLLHDEFTYFDGMTKAESLLFLAEKMAEPLPEHCLSDTAVLRYCKFCLRGTQVMLIHHGFWPILLEEGYNVPKGLAVAFSNGKISDIRICYTFCTEEKLKELALNS